MVELEFRMAPRARRVGWRTLAAAGGFACFLLLSFRMPPSPTPPGVPHSSPLRPEERLPSSPLVSITGCCAGAATCVLTTEERRFVCQAQCRLHEPSLAKQLEPWCACRLLC